MFADCIRAKIHPATWAVVAFKRDLVGLKAAPRGTAFAVDVHGHLLTSWHVTYMDEDCTEEPDEIHVLQPEVDPNRPLSAKVVARDRCRDLAILRIDGKTKGAQLNGAEDPVPWGTSCCAFGHPLSVGSQEAQTIRIFARASAGVISMPYRNQRYPGCIPIRLYEVDFFAHGGLSGGPLFDRTGSVFGVISGSLLTNHHDGGSKPTARSNLTVAIDIVEAIQLLHANGIKPQLAGHVGGAGVSKETKHGARSSKRRKRGR